MALTEYPPEVKEIFKKTKIVVLVPVFDKPDYRFMMSLVNLVGHSTQMGVGFIGMAVAHRSKTVGARNRLMEAALATKDATHFLWIDDDHIFGANILCNLLARGKDYIVPLAFQKLPPHYPVIYRVTPDNKNLYNAYVKWPKAIFRVDGAGFGMVLMSRKVAEQVKRPYFEEKTGEYGQDLHFCSKMRDLGIQMFCDGTQNILHIGYTPDAYGEADFMKYQAEELKKVNDYFKKDPKSNNEEGQGLEVGNVLV
jgi:hypothetical protein